MRFALLLIMHTIAGSQSRPVLAGSGADELSPSVMATMTTWTAAPNNPCAGQESLELMVLWRGTPGWWVSPADGLGLNGTGADTDANHSVRSIDHFVHAASGKLLVRLELPARVVVFGAQSLPIGNHNVVFVDGVDGKSPRISGSVRVGPLFAQGPDAIGTLLRQSNDAVAFLRCDRGALAAPMRAADALRLAAMRCAQIRDGAGAGR